MIIDVHTRIWSSMDQLGPELARQMRRSQAELWRYVDASTASHEQAMTCVDGSMILGFKARRLDAHVPNEFIADYVSRSPQRIGIGAVDPMAEEDIDSQVDAVIDLGLAGLTISPPCQGFHPTHSDAMRVYERAIDASLPVVVTMDSPLAASAELEFARPVHWDEVARIYPELRLVIGQLGHPWIDETLFLLSKHEHVFADICGVVSRPWQLYNTLLNAVSFGAVDKLLFGSGFPRETPAKAIETLYSVNTFSHGTQLPSIPRSHLRGIIERDSLAVLGMENVVTLRADRRSEPPRPESVSAEAFGRRLNTPGIPRDGEA